MRNVLLIIQNILKVTFRKKGNILIYIFLPLAGVILSILIYSGAGSSALRIGLLDHDSGHLAGDLGAMLAATENFKISEVDESEVNNRLLNWELDAVVVIPAGFSESIYSGEPEKVSVISVKGQDTTIWIEQVLNNQIASLYKLSRAAKGDRAMFDKLYGQYRVGRIKFDIVELEDKMTGKNMTLTSMGFLVMFIMLGANLITSLILKEKRDRTYYRICSAPVNSRQYIVANSISALLIVMLQVILIQFAMEFVFRINTGVSHILLFTILMMFGAAAVGLGLLITAFSGSSYMAGTLSPLIMTPTCMLGGCYWSVDMMPEFMQKISYFVPQRWVMDAIEKLQTGGTQGDIILNMAILAAFAAAFILTAIYRFSKTGSLQKFV